MGYHASELLLRLLLLVLMITGVDGKTRGCLLGHSDWPGRGSHHVSGNGAHHFDVTSP